MNMQVEIRPHSTIDPHGGGLEPIYRPSPLMKTVQDRWSKDKAIDCPNDLKNKVLDESQHSKTRNNRRNPRKTSFRRKKKTVDKYAKWEYGRRKDFKRRKATPATTSAATLIQKMMRGWWKRQQYKLIWLQHRLDTKEELRQAAFDRVHKHTEKRKIAFKEKIEGRAKKELEKVTVEEKTAMEGQQIIAYLRRENKKLRMKNEKIYQASTFLKQGNERLNNATKSAENGFDTLNDHAKQIKETHDKLQVVVPKYKLGIEKLEEAVEDRRQYCLSEHTIKLLYVKLLGKVVQLVEDTCKDGELVDEIIGYCLQIEGEDNRLDVPKKLEGYFENLQPEDGSDDDSENYDDYTVATLEGS